MKKLIFSIFLIMFLIGGTSSYAASYNLEVNNGIASSDGQVEAGTSISLQAAPASGYGFRQWVTSDISLSDTHNPSGQDKYDSSISFSMPSKNVSITAEFGANHTITFDGNGADGGTPVAAQTFINGRPTPLPTNTYARTGYETMGGWTTTPITNHKDYNDGQLYTATGDTTLYAAWQCIIYNITYDLRGGAVALASANPTTYTIESDDIILNNPTKTGYIFAGWKEASDELYLQTAVIERGSIGDRHYVAHWIPQNYTISYNLGGGKVSASNPTIYTIETDTFTLNNPTRDGYTFSGWTGTGLSSASTSVSVAKGSTGNRSYTANWTANTYTISYNLAGGQLPSGKTNPGSYNIESSAITLNNPERSGYTFGGWIGTGLETNTPTVTIPTGSFGNRSYTATWNIVTYTITYNLNGGTVAGGNPATYTVETPTFTLTNPTRPGYTFTGWTGSNGTTPGNVSIAKGSTGNKTYTANWTANTYTITYNLAGGQLPSGKTNPGTYNIESSAITLNNPERSGYTFGGWIGTGLETNTSTVTIPTGSFGNRSYTATWNIVTYTITYDLAGGIVGGENPLYYNVESAPITLLNPTRAGYTFGGWSGTGISGTSSNVVISTGSTGNRSYTAHWNLITYTISYNLAGGQLPSGKTNPGTYNIESSAITLNNPERSGYTFGGWIGTGLETNTQSVTIPTGSYGNRSYTATWNIVTYTITYDLAGGIVAGENPLYYNVESAPITLLNPTRAGYTFGGWSGTGISGTSSNVVIPTGSTGNRSYTAHWNLITYTISYNLAGGQLPSGKTNPGTYNIESSPITLNNPERTGYTFRGWMGTGIDTTSLSVTIPTGSIGNRSYTATWSADPYTLTYDLGGGTVIGGNPTGYNIESSPITLNNPTRPGYIFNGWTGTDVASPSLSVTIPTGSTGNRSFTANWTAITYTISYNLNGGTVSGTNPGNYTIETNTITLINPTRNGHLFTGWIGTDLDEASTTVKIYKGSMGDKEYIATWIRNSHIITVKQANNGTISPSTTSVSYGANQTFTITPNPQYGIKEVIVDGVSVGAVEEYTFSDIKDDHTITAEFYRTGYFLDINNGLQGMERIADIGEEIRVTASPEPGYRFVEWMVLGIPLEDKTVPSFTFKMPNCEVEITAVFKKYEEISWEWSTQNSLIKTICLKTNGTSIIDWGDGTTSNIINSGNKFSMSHTYSEEKNYVVKIYDDVVTYLNFVESEVVSLDLKNINVLSDIFAYNNNISSMNAGTAKRVIVDQATSITGSPSKVLKVGVVGNGAFSVSDELVVTFLTSEITTVTSMKLNGSSITVQNPYNASSLNGTNTLVATFTTNDTDDLASVFSWNWNISNSLTKTISVVAQQDTAIIWGDGTSDVIVAGERRTLTHTYSSYGIYTAGIAHDVVTELNISDSEVASVDISKATVLKKLNVSNNSLQYIDLESNIELTELIASNNNLTTVEMADNINLEKIDLENNMVSVLELSALAPIKHINVSKNNLTTLDASKHPALEVLKCANNKMNSLVLGAIVNLNILDVSNNNIEDINVSRNINLEELYCNDNKISQLALSTNTKLKYLNCANNDISTLNLVNATNLIEARIYNNKILEVNISNSEDLDLVILDLSCNLYATSEANILRLKAEGNGKIDTVGKITARFIANAGYKLQSIKLNNVTQELATSLRLGNYLGDNTIIATFTTGDSTLSGGNKPVVLDGMIPIKWNGSNWVITTVNDSDWYNYSAASKKWANVMLRDGAKYMNGGTSTAIGSKTLSELNGKTVDSNNMGSTFVWIPRYTYLIDGSNIAIKFSTGLVDDTNDGYILHPAFGFSSYNSGNPSNAANYDPELTEDYMLTGFWAAKYPAVNSSSKVSLKSGTAWSNLTIDQAFLNSKAMLSSNLSTYGVTINGDVKLYNSHLMKNVEWGAISYLTLAVGSKSATNNYTTGNNTGIYGMNSGKEFVASYIELAGGVSNYYVRNKGASLLDYEVEGHTPIASDILRYSDKVQLNLPYDNEEDNLNRLKDYYGTATTETNGTANIPNKTNPFFVRGNSSMLDYSGVDGSANSSISFRPTIVIKKDLEYTITFNTAGGNSIASITGAYNDPITIPNDPVRAGYRFIGWDTEIPSRMPAQDLTITAAWLKEDYSISYELNGGSATNSTSYNVETNTFTLNNPTKANSTFAGWNEKIKPANWFDGFINSDTGVIEEFNSSFPNSVYSELIFLKGGATYIFVKDDNNSIRWRAYNLDGTYRAYGQDLTYTPTSDAYVRILLYLGATEEVKNASYIIAKVASPVAVNTIEDIEWTEGFVNMDTGVIEGISPSYPNAIYSELIELKAGHTYTLSGAQSLGEKRWRVYNLDGTYAKSASSDTSYTPNRNVLARILFVNGYEEAYRNTLMLTEKMPVESSKQISKGSTGDRIYEAGWNDTYSISYNTNDDLPAGYIGLEYIKSNGSQWIDTEFNATSNTNIEYDFEYISGNSGWVPLIGQRVSTSANMFTFWINSSDKTIAVNYNGVDTGAISGTNGNGRHVYSNRGNKFYLDGNLIKTISVSSFTSSQGLAICGLRTSASAAETRNIQGKIYSLKIFENDILVRHFVPCINPDGIVGMYDVANGKFHAVKGSGAFTPSKAYVTSYNVNSSAITLPTPARTGYTFVGWTGSNGEVPTTTVTIPAGTIGNKTYTANWTLNTYTINYVTNTQLPIGYIAQDYIQSTGTQYIDTGFASSNGYYAEAQVVLDEITGASIIGAHNLTSPYGRNYLAVGTSTNWELGTGDNCPQVTTHGTQVRVGRKYSVEYSTVKGNSYIKVDGTQIFTSTDNTARSSNNLLVFTDQYAMNNEGQKAKVKLYSLKIYNSSRTLVRNFIPCISPSGEVGLYDIVNSRFYGNNGTGEFAKITNYDTSYTVLDSAIILPTPQKAGYTFSGWYTAQTGGSKVGDAGSAIYPRANTTLYARWT